LFRPGFWLHRLQPPFDARPAAEIFAARGPGERDLDYSR
jgi:hypothetical protein